MKLNYAPQAGLRRRRPDHQRERLAFWGGIAIVALFELILMAKTWPAFENIQWPWSDPQMAALIDPEDGSVSPLPYQPD